MGISNMRIITVFVTVIGYRRSRTNVYAFMGTDTARNPKNASTSNVPSIHIRMQTNTVILYGYANENRSFYHYGNKKFPSLVVSLVGTDRIR